MAQNGAANGSVGGKPKTAAAGRPKSNLDIPGSLAWGFSILLIAWGLLSPIDHLTQDNGQSLFDRLPVFLSLRDPQQDGIMFSTHRYRQHPFTYGLAHVVPAITWCLLMPFQLSASFRRRRPQVHRMMGYTLATCGVSLALSGIFYPFSKHYLGSNLSFSHEDPFHLHRLVIQGRTVLVWGTFDAGLMIIFPIQSYTLYRTVKAARAKRFAEHNTWAVLYAIAGYTISLFRVGLTSNLFLGAFLHFIASDSLKAWLGVPEKGPQLAEAERAAFAAGIWFFAAPGYLLWTGYVLSKQRPVFDEEKPKRVTARGNGTAAKPAH